MTDEKCKICLVESYDPHIIGVDLYEDLDQEDGVLSAILSSVASAAIEIAHSLGGSQVYWLEAAENGEGWEDVCWVEDRCEGTLLPRAQAERFAEGCFSEEWDVRGGEDYQDFEYGTIVWRLSRTCRASVVEEV